MQTFLPGGTPGSEFTTAAAILDDKRLGNQRNEAMIIHNSLTTGKGWPNHSATKMWTGYEQSLVRYGLEITREWRARGKRDTTFEWFLQRLEPVAASRKFDPPWLGDNLMQATHRSSLLRKNPDYYSRFGWDEPHDLEYVWPVLDVMAPQGYTLKITKGGYSRIRQGLLQNPFEWAQENRPSLILPGVVL